MTKGVSINIAVWKMLLIDAEFELERGALCGYIAYKGDIIAKWNRRLGE